MRSNLLLGVVASVLSSVIITTGQEIPRGGYFLAPRVVKAVKPTYTPKARAARVEGSVLVDVVVQPDGTVGDDVKVVRSLDTRFGLDEQAVKAAKQWRFKPATKDGEPVATHITIELSFRLNSRANAGVTDRLGHRGREGRLDERELAARELRLVCSLVKPLAAS